MTEVYVDRFDVFYAWYVWIMEGRYSLGSRITLMPEVDEMVRDLKKDPMVVIAKGRKEGWWIGGKQ